MSTPSPGHFSGSTDFEYSNANYDVLALVVQRVSGTPFADYPTRHVYQPLGMTRTTTDPALAQRAGLATGRRRRQPLDAR